MIASGPAYPDSSTCADARRIAEQYGLRLSPEASQCLERETPKVLDNVETLITGSVRELCAAASAACRELGYEPVLLTDSLDCEAREAGDVYKRQRIPCSTPACATARWAACAPRPTSCPS